MQILFGEPDEDDIETEEEIAAREAKKAAKLAKKQKRAEDAKLAKEEHVAMQVLERICAELDCNIWDIMEFKELDQVRRKMRDKSLRKS